MGERVFNNQLFDHWLDTKSQEILAKVDKERITTEEVIILTLKAQTNHFHHMDGEFREEFKSIREELKDFREKFKEVDRRFNKIDERFDQRFDRLNTILMWGFGLMFTSLFGIYFKLFFH